MRRSPLLLAALLFSSALAGLAPAAIARAANEGAPASPPPAPAAPKGPSADAIEVYRKAPGTKAGKAGLLAVQWKDLKLEEVKRSDLQLGANRVFKGVPLKAFLFAAPKTDAEDLAILRFRNGMQVPVPLDVKTLDKLNIFVAREMRDPETGKYGADLGQLIHERAPWMEQRAIVFSGNKIVISDPWHPALGATTTKFSPWAHVDSLVAVELVNRDAWEKQFRVSEEPRILQGMGTFMARCQFCHGVRETGASFGWDFVKPVPMHTWRAPESLLYHVKFKKLDAAERGLLMPPQPDAEIDEIRALWDWMQAASAKELNAYRP